jgi:hypothetical protein
MTIDFLISFSFCTYILLGEGEEDGEMWSPLYPLHSLFFNYSQHI